MMKEGRMIKRIWRLSRMKIWMKSKKLKIVNHQMSRMKRRTK
jgi:hypothetical protein